MKSAIKVAALSVLLTFMTGCRHKKQPMLPRQTQAPVVTAEPPVNTSELPPVPPPAQPNVSQAAPEAPPQKPKRRHKSKTIPVKTDAPAAGAPDQQPAASASQPAAIPPADSPIGQLSTSSDSVGEENPDNTVKLINSTEKSLNGIKRSLTADEQTTVTQIHSFLDKARQAMAANDLDGAHTLATKAKVLLDELTKE